MDDFDTPLHHECQPDDKSCNTTNEIFYVYH